MKSCRKKRHKISRESVYLFGMEASVNNFYLSTGIFISRVIILDNSKHCHPLTFREGFLTFGTVNYLGQMMLSGREGTVLCITGCLAVSPDSP